MEDPCGLSETGSHWPSRATSFVIMAMCSGNYLAGAIRPGFGSLGSVRPKETQGFHFALQCIARNIQ
jgi:hypothetical protein